MPKVDSTRVIAQGPLDKSQLAFCTEPEHAVRLLAPAGSGKTHSLLWRCLLLNRASSENLRFLVFTFSRAAKDELRDRLHGTAEFRDISPLVDVSTLNSWGLRRLKLRRQYLKNATNKKERYFCITNLLQPEWQEFPLIKQAITSTRKWRNSHTLMDLIDEFKSIGFRHDIHDDFRSFKGHVEWLRDNGMLGHWLKALDDLRRLEIIPDSIAADLQPKDVFESFFPFWKQATLRMNGSAMLTFEDQKYWACREVEEALEAGKYTTGVHRYHEVLVDEFQDINPLDLSLLTGIANLNKARLCIVGDDDQAIYEWRGATPQFILNPDNYLGGGYKTYILERNYRSPKNVVDHSQLLIKHNKNRVDKKIKAVSEDLARIEVVQRKDLHASIDYVLREVKRLLDDPEINRIGIVSRKRSQIIPYQIVFAGEDMPFYAAEDLQIWLSDAFNSMKDFLMLKAQLDIRFPMCPEPVEPLLKLCDQVKRLKLNANDRGELKAFLLNRRPKSLREALALLYEYRGPIKGTNTGGRMSEHFHEIISAFLETENLSDAIRSLSENFEGLHKDYGKSLDDIFYADPPFTFLADYAQRYGDDCISFYEDVQKAISTLARLPPDDENSPSTAPPQNCRVHLMTALRAKGREFDAVFILDCNDGVFPMTFADTEAKIEAERRLFYVAMTRAKKRLTFVVNKQLFGAPAVPSPFLAEAGLL